MIVSHAKSLEPSLSFNMTTRSRRSASFTCSSSNKLKDARTYAVRAPFAKKTVPGSARTPPSKALVRMTISESPSLPRRSLNLHVLPLVPRSGTINKGNDVPEKHPGFWGIPFRYVVEMPLHGSLENVALGTIERGYVLDVGEEALSAPRTE